MVYPERPSSVPTEHCPSCGVEMRFSGMQSAGLAQFFCEACQYRHDRFVERSASEGNRAHGD